MKAHFLFLPLLLLPFLLPSQESAKEKIVYLIPGQGSDGRLFGHLAIEGYETKALELIVPEKREGMAAYARRMASQIDTTKRYSIIGVSLGGMVAVEMGKFLPAEEVILIASAKTKDELPGYCHFFQGFPLYKILGGRFYKFWIWLLQPVAEPMDKESRKVWRDMLRKKDPTFMKRAVECIIKWDNEEYGDNVFHIHGTRDRTIPISNVNADWVVPDGRHVMTMTRGEEIAGVVNRLLK